MELVVLENSVEIKDGLVTIYSDSISPDIYAFVHDTEEPHCHHFRASSPRILLQSDMALVFTQEYEYLGNTVSLEHKVTVFDSVSWNIKQLDPYESTPCRFGISMPIYGNVLVEDELAEPLINYEQHWRYNWQGQTNINLPIIKISSPPQTVSVPLEENVQFFSYSDNDQRRLKVATMYEEDYSLSITMSADLHPDYKEEYLRLHPEAYSYVYQWKTLFNKVEHKYGITVNHQLARHSVSSRLLDESELDRFASNLELALSFYPSSIWDNNSVNNIIVCGDIRVGDKEIHGQAHRDGIVINGSESDFNIQKAIHHELYHILDNKSIGEEWESLPKTDLFYDRYNMRRPDDIDSSEYRAELFARYIVDPVFVHSLIEQDKTVKAKWDLTTAALNDECRHALENHIISTESTGVVSIRATFKEIEDKITGDLCFAAMKHAETSVIDNIIEQNIDWQDLSKIPKESNLIYLTINPLDFCAIEYFDHGISSEISIEEWLSSHRMAVQLSAKFLPVEKIYQSQWSFVRRFFSNSNLTIKEHKIGSKNLRATPLKGVPMLKSVWESIRSHVLVEKTGYHQMSFKE